MTNEHQPVERMNSRLAELKRRFIVPNDAIVDLVKQRHRTSVFVHFYCPYSPCCSQCVGIFTFRELMGHLRRVHHHGAERIKQLVKKGLPKVPARAHS